MKTGVLILLLLLFLVPIVTAQAPSTGDKKEQERYNYEQQLNKDPDSAIKRAGNDPAQLKLLGSKLSASHVAKIDEAQWDIIQSHVTDNLAVREAITKGKVTNYETLTASQLENNLQYVNDISNLNQVEASKEFQRKYNDPNINVNFPKGSNVKLNGHTLYAGTNIIDLTNYQEGQNKPRRIQGDGKDRVSVNQIYFQKVEC